MISSSPATTSKDRLVQSRRRELPKPCQICGAEKRGAHWGVEVCRACTTFFRRAILTLDTNQWMTVHCTKGGKCTTGRNCKPCRFNRCIRMGMKPERVDPCKEQKGIDVPGPSTSPESPAPTFYFLKRIHANYRELMRERDIVECAILKDRQPVPVQLEGRHGELITVYPCTTSLFDEIVQAFVPSRWNFLHSSFHELAELPPDQKFALFRHFSFNYALALAMQRGIELLKERPLQHHMLTKYTYFLYSDLSEFFGDANPMSSSHSILRSTAKMFTHCRDFVIPSLENLNLEEMEFATLLALLFWTANCSDMSPTTEAMGDRYRSAIFNELHAMYREELGIENYANRLGDFMSLYHTIQASVHEIVGEFRLLDVYEFLSNDSFLSVMVNPLPGEQVVSKYV